MRGETYALADFLHPAGRVDSGVGGDVHDWFVAVAVAGGGRDRADFAVGDGAPADSVSR